MSQAYLFFGKAGSGKGTQALQLKEYLESQGRAVLYIETGELFRKFVADSASFAAKRTSEVIDSGQLMPPFFPVYLWAHELIQKFDGTQDVILDGVARRMEEAVMIESAFQFFKIDTTYVFNIHIDDQTAINRLAMRGDRADDSSLEKIQKRLDWFKLNVVLAIEYFKQHEGFKFFEIDGEKTVEEIHNEIIKTLS